MNIKRKIIELCDEMIALWNGLKKEIESIPSEDEVELVCRWHDYFREHGDIVGTFGETKRVLKEAEERLIMERKLKYED